MARGYSRLGTWQLLLTISMVIAPLSAHGRHSLTRRHHHHNQSSVNKEALNARMVLSDDSAEREHLIGAGPGVKLPVRSHKHHHSHKHARPNFAEEPAGEELTAGGAGSDHQLSDDIVTVEFHSPAPDFVPSDEGVNWAKPPQAQKQKGEPSDWTLSDFYDYTSRDDDLSALDTTPEPEPTPSPPADMEDENPLLAGSPALPEYVSPGLASGPALQAPPTLGGDKGQGVLGVAMGPDGCRLGFARSTSGACLSQCEVEPNFCFNGGVCTVVPGSAAFCRCNVQDYIWNKGARCDWAVTEFQVLSVVVGVSSLVALLLFMIIVLFAKSMHRLKNENKRLRRRSKYRPQSSEPQTDGLSVSTTADGSQPNVRKLCDSPPPAPQAHTHNLAYYDNIICQDDPQKQEDPAKSPQPKEEGSMNILNSHSPKHENNRPTSVAHTPNNTEENSEDGVTIGLEVLLPKEAKLHTDSSAPLQYDVFLYKVPNNGDPANSHPSTHLMSKSPKHSKASSVRHSSPGCDLSPGRHPTTSRHSAPGCYSAPASHAASHSTQYKCQSSSSTTPPQLRRPRGRSQERGPRQPGMEMEHQRGHIRPSPSSPHLCQPPSSPSRMKSSPVSTRSLPPLS
ncbi:chondroitin sulfate proteoglycan 5-like isoform X1 [Synchiropus splendidus]|uniref:chondroitin sulfate proteoglycan 5-like isoform X1 n=1 Tax=Synchiropus splendidus TaxID=270530 RepID=UPI00237EA61B|nr:chondroitin sulfate proteoglycan 5-like isoform X1 [Synchiropus splendidus]